MPPNFPHLHCFGGSVVLCVPRVSITIYVSCSLRRQNLYHALFTNSALACRIDLFCSIDLSMQCGTQCPIWAKDLDRVLSLAQNNLTQLDILFESDLSCMHCLASEPHIVRERFVPWLIMVAMTHLI